MVDLLPLWAMRDYERIWEEGSFKIIQTHKTRYTLDILNLSGNYYERRLKSLDMILPYKLYPIRKRFEYIDQVLTHRNRQFIDIDGNVLLYKPTRFIQLKTDRIIARWRASNGDVMFRVNGCPRTFRTQLETDHTYLTYAKDGNRFYMYKLCHTKEAPSRKKI